MFGAICLSSYGLITLILSGFAILLYFFFNLCMSMDWGLSCELNYNSIAKFLDVLLLKFFSYTVKLYTSILSIILFLPTVQIMVLNVFMI